MGYSGNLGPISQEMLKMHKMYLEVLYLELQ